MASFSKKHYKIIAGIVKELDTEYRLYAFNRFCIMFKEDNPLFDKEKFAIACGM